MPKSPRRQVREPRLHLGHPLPPGSSVLSPHGGEGQVVSLSGRWGCLKLTTRGQSTRTAKGMSKVMTLAWPLTLPRAPGPPSSPLHPTRLPLQDCPLLIILTSAQMSPPPQPFTDHPSHGLIFAVVVGLCFCLSISLICHPPTL